MLGKSVCILLSGKAGVGKTTSADYLCSYLPTVGFANNAKANFARGLKTIARKSFYWDGEKDDKGRALLQSLGQAGRAYNENIWVGMTMDELLPNTPGYPFDFITVDDWRFPNEANYIMKDSLYSLYMVRIIAKNREILSGPLANEISETALDTWTGYNYIIENSGTMDNLQAQLRNIVEDILKHEKQFGGK